MPNILTPGFLYFDGLKYVTSPGTGPVGPAAGDLGGTYPSPFVVRLTGDGINPIHVGSRLFAWEASVTGPVGITQDQSLTGAGTAMEIVAQSAAAGSNSSGGALFLASGAGDGPGAPGNLALVTADFQNGIVVVPNLMLFNTGNNTMLTLGGTLSTGGGLALGNNAGAPFDLSAGATITLTPDQYKYPHIIFGGILPNNTTVVFPANVGSKWVIDATGVTLSGHTLTLQANGINWSTTIGTTNLYEVFLGGTTGQLYGNVLTP